MNKAFKKYGKAKFSSIIPKRTKIKIYITEAIRSAVISSSMSIIEAVRKTSATMEEKILLISRITNTPYDVSIKLANGDHPIQARKEPVDTK